MFLPKTVFQYRILHLAVVLALLLALVPSAVPVQAVSTSIVISQVYGGGGGSGATYKNDFIELFNLGMAPVNVNGWTLQYASATGSTWQVTALSGTIQSGKNYLVQEAAGTSVTVRMIDLPAPDVIGTIAMSATAGKVALVNNSTPLTGACPTGLVDFVGFGPTATCSETAPTAILSNTTAALRKSNGSLDTDNNSTDFSVGTPLAHNSVFPFAATGLAIPAAPGETSTLTVTVTPGTNLASTGIAVSCDLTPISGSAAQVMFDNGTNGDATAGDNTFTFTAAVPGNTTGGLKNLLCTISDAQSRSFTATTGLIVIVPVPIGTVNGPVLDTDAGNTHNSAYMNQTASVKGVIYEKTLQAVSNSPNTNKGFYIQNTVETGDTNPNTSDGLFVYLNTESSILNPGGADYTPVVGEEVILFGTVTEFFNMTQMTNPTLVKPVVRSGVVLDTELPPVVANPPVSVANANRYWERLQGMRVQVPANSVVLGGRNVFSPADAEIWLARSDSTVAQRVDPFARRAFRDAHPLDDNFDPTNWDGNGYRILIGSLGIKATAADAQALLVPARSFDTVTNAPVGGINYSFSKYRIEISTQPTLSHGLDPATNTPPTTINRGTAYSIVDYNLENLYDFRDNPFSGCDFAGNAGCSNTGTPFIAAVNPPFDYVPANDADYQARLTDIAKQIVTDLHSPDILMVQEVENQDICTITSGALTCGVSDNADDKPDVLQELAFAISANGGPAYDAAFDRDSSDLRGIVPAFLYRTDRVELLPAQANDPVLGSSPTVTYPGTVAMSNTQVSNPKTLNAALPAGVTACETNSVFPRAASTALFRITSTSFGKTTTRDVYVINNHFKSAPDTCVAHRTEQAKYNAAIVQAIQAANPNARIVLGGDLNVYPRPDDPVAAVGQPGSTDQLGALYDSSLGLKNLWDVLVNRAPQAAYSYVFLGMAQTLDQMFVNQAMLRDLQQVQIAHINSDFPADNPDDVARGTSDHDPTVAVFAGSNTFYFPLVGNARP